MNSACHPVLCLPQDDAVAGYNDLSTLTSERKSRLTCCPHVISVQLHGPLKQKHSCCLPLSAARQDAGDTPVKPLLLVSMAAPLLIPAVLVEEGAGSPGVILRPDVHVRVLGAFVPMLMGL